MRLFLAIYPPKEVLDYIRMVTRELDKEKRNLRYIPIDQIHLTAKFFGARVSVSSKQKIAKEFLRHAGSFPKPVIEISGVQLGFHRQQKPRVVLLNVENDSGLDEFVDFAHRTTRALKLRDTIKWKQKDLHDHHISVARLKDAAINNSSIRRAKQLVKSIDITPPEPFEATEAYLVKSTLSSKGKPVYEKMEKIIL